MPTRGEHVDQSERNEAASGVLDAAAHYDWAVTTLFYASLHLIDAYTWPTRHVGHARRKNYAATDPALARMYIHYAELYDRSQDARYDCVHFTAQRFSDLRSLDYEPLRTHIRGLLGM